MYQALLCMSLFVPAGEPCPCPSPNTCVREPVVTKVNTPKYTFKCSEICLTHYKLFGCLCGHKEDCADCHPKKRRDLVKKICTEEKCEMKCVLKPCECAPAAVPVMPAPASPPMLLPAK